MAKPAKHKLGKRVGGAYSVLRLLFIIALGTIQLVSTFHTYALNLTELNGLKREEASLIAKKQELENDIKRWDDKAYITARPVNASASYSPANRPCVCFIPKP